MGRKKHFTTIIALRGCLHNCPYGDSAASWNRRVNFRAPENVSQKLIEVQENFNVKYVRLIGGYFTAKMDW